MKEEAVLASTLYPRRDEFRAHWQKKRQQFLCFFGANTFSWSCTPSTSKTVHWCSRRMFWLFNVGCSFVFYSRHAPRNWDQSPKKLEFIWALSSFYWGVLTSRLRSALHTVRHEESHKKSCVSTVLCLCFRPVRQFGRTSPRSRRNWPTLMNSLQLQVSPKKDFFQFSDRFYYSFGLPDLSVSFKVVFQQPECPWTFALPL